MVLDPSLFGVTRSADLSLSVLHSIIDEYRLMCKLDGKSPATRDTYENRLTTFCQYLVDKKCDLAIAALINIKGTIDSTR